MDYSTPDSSVHLILQATILEWVAIHFSRGSSLPRDTTLFHISDSSPPEPPGNLQTTIQWIKSDTVQLNSSLITTEIYLLKYMWDILYFFPLYVLCQNTLSFFCLLMSFFLNGVWSVAKLYFQKRKLAY